MARHRFVVLDSLRGICACMIVLLHVRTQGHIASLSLVTNSYLFVDFFFVLSGFVIGCSYGDRLANGFSAARFMLLRLGRIYPLHLAVLALFLAFEIVFALFLSGAAQRRPFEGSFSPEMLLHSLLLVQIFPGSNALAWNLPSWSIAAEFWTYLLFALLLRLAGRWIVPIALMIAVAVPLFLLNEPGAMFENGFLRCVFGFALGLIGWRCVGRIRDMRCPAWLDHALEAVLVAAVVMFIALLGRSALSVGAPFLFLVTVLVFARERGFVSELLKKGPFLVLGGLSYSIYMIHMFLYSRLLNGLSLVEARTGLDLVVTHGGGNSIGGGAWFGDAASLGLLALVVLCAYGSYRLVELPGQRLARKLAGAVPGVPDATLKSAAKRPM